MFGRNTEPVRAYPLHQDEVRAPQADDPLSKHEHGHLWRQWLERLPEIHLRYVEPDITQRNLHFAGNKPVVQQHADYKPPIFGLWRAQGDTEGEIPAINPKTPIPDPAHKLTPADLPDWLVAKVPGQSGPMPVVRARYQLEKPPIEDLPTVPTSDSVVQRLLSDLPPADWLTDDNGETWPAEQSTSALERLSELAAQPDDDDTKEVPAYMRQRHMKESE